MLMKRIFTSRGGTTKRKRKTAEANRGPKALAGSISSFCRVLAVSAITALGVGEAGALTYYWDGTISGGTSLGGGGIWNSATTASWWNGTSDVTWNPLGTDAIFGGNGAIVNVSNTVQVVSLTLNGDGYTLGGNGTIQLTGGTIPTGGTVITVNNAGSTSHTARITTSLEGSVGFTKSGSGTLILDSDNSGATGLTGGITMAGGTLVFDYSNSSLTTILKPTNALTFSNTSEFQFQASTAFGSSAASMSLAALTFRGGEATVHSIANSSLANSLLTFSSLQPRVAGATGNFVQDSLPQTFNVTAGGAGTTLTLNNTQAGKITVGDSVTGVNIAAPVVVSGTRSANSDTITLTSVAGLSLGMAVSGAGIPAGEVITGISGNDVTMTSGAGVTAGTGSVTFAATVTDKLDNGNGTSTLTLSNAMTGVASLQNVTFGLANKRIVLGGQSAGFINQGVFFNGGSYAWYDTTTYARVRAINYGVDANTATQGDSTGGIAGSSLNKHVQVNGLVTGQGDLTINTLNLNAFTFGNGIIQNPGTTLTLTNAGILKSNGGLSTITGGTIAALPGIEFVIRVDGAPTDRLTINSILTGTGGVTKSGPGILQLSAQTAGALSFSGSATTLGSTTLQLAFDAPSLAAYVAAKPPGTVPVYGPGIPANTTIASISGTTVTLSQAATGTSSFPLSYSTPLDTSTGPLPATAATPFTLNITAAQAATVSVGQIVTGANIQPNTKVTAIVGGVITIDKAVTASVPLQNVTFGGATVAFGDTQNFNVTAGLLGNDHATTNINSNSLTLFTAIPSLVAGMSVDGPGIAAGTTIASVVGTAVTLSQVATDTSAANFGAVNTYLAQVGNGGNTTVLSTSQANTLALGALVTGVNIPSNTTVSTITTTGNPNTRLVTFSKNSPAQQSYSATVGGGATTLTLSLAQALTVFAGTSVGQIAGVIPAGTSVVSVDTATGIVTLSNPTTGAVGPQTLSFAGATNQNLTFGGASLSFGASTLTLTPAQAAGLVVGSSVTGTNIQPNTTITSIQDKGSYQIATLSLPTTGLAAPEFVSFGGATVVAINSAYGGGTKVNAGTFTVGSAGLPAPVTVSGTTAAGIGSITVINPVAAGLVVGMAVTGPTIPAGTVITGISGNTVNITNGPGVTGGTNNLTFQFPVTIAGGAGFSALNSIIPNSITLTGANAVLSTAGGTAAGFSGAIAAGVNDFQFISVDPVVTANLLVSGSITGTGQMGIPQASTGIVTLTGNNSGFTGPVVIENSATLSVARLNSLSYPVTNAYSVTGGGGSSTITLTPAQARLLVVGAAATGANIGANTTVLSINNTTGLVTLSNPITGPVTAQNITFAQVTGNPVNLTGTLRLALDGNGGAAYASGGNGTGAPQTLALNNAITLAGSGTIQPDRDGTAYGGYFTTASNKTILLNTLDFSVQTLTIQNNRGSGVQFTGTTTLGGAGNFNVVNATTSNVVQGLTLSGLLVGGGTDLGQNTFTKSGSGTLVLANTGNTFGGNASVINIAGGVLSVASDSVMGDLQNTISLNNPSGATLRATGTFATARKITLNAVTANTIEVTAGNTLTLNSQFVLPIGSETNPLVKADNGTLVISANNNLGNQSFSGTAGGGGTTIQLSPANALLLSANAIGRTVTGLNIDANTVVLGINTTTGVVTVDTPTLNSSSTQTLTFNGAPWNGLLTINAGAVRVFNGTALGGNLGSVTVVRTGAALQLSGGATVSDRITVSGSGLGSAGALQSVAGTNTASGQLILAAAAAFGADSGATLNLTGGITGVSGVNLTLNSAGSGIINITGNALDPAYAITGDLGSTTKISNVSNVANLLVGMRLSGTGIPAGTTITGIGPNVALNLAANELLLSTAATITSTQPLSAQGLLNVVKTGTGLASLGVNSPTFGGSLTVNQGTFAIGGSGVTIGPAAAANTITIQGPSGNLVLNDTVGALERIAVGPTYTASVGGGTSVISLSAAEAATLTVGQTVTGVGIAPNTTVQTIRTTGNGVITGIVDLSGSTTGTVGPQNLTFAARNVILAGGTLSYTGNTGGSVQNFGWLTALRGATNVIASNQTGGGNVLITFGGLASNTNAPTNATPPANSIAGDATIDFQGATIGTDGTNRIMFVTAPTLTNNILQRATINGVDFVSYNTNGTAANVNGIQAFTAYNLSNNINAAAVTDTLSLTADTASNFSAPKTINAFKISGGISVGDTGLQGNTLTLSTGGILSTTGNNTLNFKTITFGAQGFVAVNTSGQLTVGSQLTGGGGFIKELPGLLLMNAPDDRAGYVNLSGQTLTGNFVVAAGTVQLGGGNNTLTPNQFLIVAPGATLDLNGTSQFALGTRGDGAVFQGNAGTFTNSNASPAALILGLDNGAVNFGGVIQQDVGKGAMSFFKGSGQIFNFLNANTYSGPTVLAGGVNTLLDGGTLSATSSIDLNYARLVFNDDATFALANRVNVGATITMRGGSLTYANGRAQTETTQTVGAVVLSEGQNMIQSVTGGIGVNSAVLTLASLTRAVGSTATVRFIDTATPTLGLIGNTGRIVVTAAPTLSQNLIGPWAVVDREYASYIPTLGVGALNQTGFAGYSPQFLNRLAQTGGTVANPLFVYPGENIRATLSVPGLTGDTTVNTLAVNTNVAAVGGVPVPTIVDLGGKKLTLSGGGLLLALGGDTQNITVRNGTLTSTGPGVGIGSDLYVQALNYSGNNRTFIISAGIADNGIGPVRLIKSSGSADTALATINGDFLMLSGVNTYSGGTVVNGGNLVVGATGNIPAGGITVSGGEVSGVGAVVQDPGGTIHGANTVTLNGLGALTLSGNNTLAGLVFNNSGVGSGVGGTAGTAIAATVTTFRSLSPIGTGTLTLTGGITSTPVNPAAAATVAGRLDFGGLPSTVTVNAYNFSTFTDVAPTTAGLILQGVVGSAGTITKLGAGVLQLNAQDVFTGQLLVRAGTLQIGVGNGGSRFAQLNLVPDAGQVARLNLNNQATTFGSLAGSGIITSTSGTPTLTVGFDNTSTTFSGQFSRFNDATPGAVILTKIGDGTLTLSSAQSGTTGSSGGVTVSGGGLTYSGAGAAYPSTQLTPVTYNVNSGGTITLDNTATALASANVNNRLLGLGGGSNGTLQLAGGTLALNGNAVVDSSEAINVLNFNAGASTIRLTPGGGATSISVTSISNQGGQDSGLITGNGLNGSGAGSVNVIVPGGGFLAVGGGGGPTQPTIPIRADLLGDTTGGQGTGFLMRDPTFGNLRPLIVSFDGAGQLTNELDPNMGEAALTGATSNTGIISLNNATTNKIIASQTINSLTMVGDGTPTLLSGLGLPAGVFGPNGLPLTLTVGSGGILALSNATIGVGAIGSGGTTEDYHVVGAGTTLTVNSSIIAATAGIVKADAGTLIFNARQYYTGSAGTNGTTVNDGTLKLGGGNNTLLVQPTGSIPTVLSLFMNGGTLDLNGNSQIVERISNNNPNAGAGGVIINSGVTAVTLTSATGTSTTFSGSIGTGILTAPGNAINFIKSGAGVLALTNVNSYTGATVIRGGGLTIQDSGTLATSAITDYFGTLLLNEAGLNPLGVNPVRIPAAAPITLHGGTLQQNSGGSLDASATFNTVTLGSGGNTITQSTVQSAGSSAMISIGSLVQATDKATVNFASGNGTLGGGGLNNNQIQITSITPSGSSAKTPSSLVLTGNGMLPAWITVNNGSDFAGYLTSPTVGSLGIGALGSTNYPAYAAPNVPFTATAMAAAQIPANANSSFNVSITATVLPVAGRLVNSIAVRNPAANVAALIPINLPSDTLSIASGGLLTNASNGGASITLQGGRVTAGSVANAPGVLYLTSTGTNSQTINSQIVDNGSQTLSANTDGISNVVTVGSTAGLVLGQTVNGTGIPLNSIITSINPNGTSFTIGSNTNALSFRFADPSLTKTNTATISGSQVVTLANATSLAVGMYVTGPGIPAGTTLVSLGTTAVPNVVTLSNALTATMSQQTYFFNNVGNNNTVFTVSPAVAATLTAGMSVTNVTGTSIPAGTTITAVSGTTVQLSNPTTGTASTQQLNFGATLNFARLGTYLAMAANTTLNGSTVTVNNTTGLVVGMSVSGAGIPPGALIGTIPSGTTITLAGPPTTALPNGPAMTATVSNTGINLTFGSGISVSNGTSVAGAVSLVKTGSGTMTLSPQLVMNGSMNNNPLTNTTITVPTTVGLLAGMTVTGSGIPANSTISAITGPNTYTLSTSANSTQGAQLTYGPGTAIIPNLATSAFSNTYTGGTFVNQGTLVLSGIAGSTVIPGDITINNATVTMNTNPQQIVATGNVAINGGGTLNLTGTNVLASVAFNNSGGSVTPVVALGTSGILTLTNGITSVNDSLSFTPTISGTNSVLMLPNGAITTTGASPDSLLVSVPVTPTGALRLNPTVTVSGTTVGGSDTFTVVSSAGLVVGMSVTGANLPAGEVITGISGNAITVSTGTGVGGGPTNLNFVGTGSLILTPSIVLNTTTSAGSASFTVSNTGGLSVGMGVSGGGLPAGESIASISGNTITLTTGTGVPAGTSNLTFSGNTFTGGFTLNSGSLIASQSTNQLATVAPSITATTNVITVASTAGLAVGMAVSGSGIPAGEFITAIGAGTITITTATNVTGATNSTLTFTGANTVLAGPAGTGALNMADGTALMGDGSGLRVIGNAVNIALNATFGPLGGSTTALANNGVTLTGPVILTGGGAHTITVPDLLNVTTISGQLSGGNNLNLTKAGTGTLVLSNQSLAGTATANTFSGTTTVNVAAGVLRLGASAVVPAGLNLSVSPGAVYDINGSVDQILSTLSGGGMVTNSNSTARTLFIGGTTIGDITSNLGNTAIFDGILAAPNTGSVAVPNYTALAVTKVGLGRQVLNGASLYTGATNVNAGSLIVNGSLANTAVTVAGGATLGGTGSIGNSVAGTVTLAGGTGASTRGIFDLTTNSAIAPFTLNTSVVNALTVGGTSSNNPSVFNFDIGSFSTDQINITGGGTFRVQLGGAIVNLTQLSGSPLAPGNYNLINYASATYGTTLTQGTVTAGASVTTFAANGYILNQTASALILNVGGVPLQFFWKGNLDNVWSNAAGTTNWVKDTIGGPPANVVPNPTAIVNFNATGFTPGNVTTTLGSNFTIDQLIFNTTANTPVTIGGSFALTLNNNIAMASAAGGNVTISTTSLLLGGTQSWINSTANTLTVSSAVSGGSPLVIGSSSTGKVVLSGNNSGLTGGITVNGSGSNVAVQLGSATALGPNNTANPLNSLAVNAGAIDMNGQSATVGSLSSTAVNGIIKNNSGASVLTVFQGGTSTYSGSIQDGTGTVKLIVDGGGTLQFITTGNSYSGGTVINNATLRMGNGGGENQTSLGTGLVTINGGGALSFAPTSNTNAYNIFNSFSLAGGRITSSGGNQHLGNNGAGQLKPIDVTASGGTITPSGTASQDLFLDGQLTGSGPLTVGGTGSGKVILTNNTVNASSYSGTLTSTSAGNLQLAGSATTSTALASANLFLATNANGLTFGSVVTSATLGSLGGGGNFALQNTATTVAPVALTIGGNGATTSFTGLITNSGTLAGSLTKNGAGIFTLGSGAAAYGPNTYRGTTTVNGGAFRVNSGSATASVTGLGNVFVNSNATLGGNGVIQGGDGTTAQGIVTLASGSILDPGFGTNSFGTLRFGPQTAAVQNTLLTFSSGSTYKFDVGATAGSQDRVSVVGPAVIAAGASLTINSVNTPDQGRYTLLSSTTAVSGTFAVNAPGIPGGYSLVYTGNTVDLQRFSAIGTIGTPAGLQVIKGASVAFDINVQNSAPTGSSDLSFTANSTPGSNTTGSVGPAIVVGAQTSGTGTGLSFSSAAVSSGAGRTGTFTVSAGGSTTAAPTSVLGSVSVDVFDHASTPVNVSLGTLTFQPVRVGYVGPAQSLSSLAAPNAAATPGGLRVNLQGIAPAAIGNLSLTSFTGVAPGSSGQIRASLASGQAAGTFNQAFTYSLGDDSTLNGTNNGALGPVSINVTGSVYNGQGLWGGGAGSWGDFSKWTMTVANPGGYPGLDGPDSINDTATFGSNLVGSATLDGVAPTLNSLTFTGTSGSIAPGSGAGTVLLQNNQNVVAPTISVSGGSPTVSAPMVFANNVTATITGSGDTLTISGAVTGAGGLTKTGPGTLVLSNVTNVYSGKTAVNGGTLRVAADTSLGTVPSSVVPDQISIDNGAKLAFTGGGSLSLNQGITVGSGNGTIDVATNQTVVVNSVISGTLSGSGTTTGTLTKTGGGTLNIRNNIQALSPLAAPSFVLSAGTLSLVAGPWARGTTATSALNTGGITFSGGTLAINIQGTGGIGSLTGTDYMVADNGSAFTVQVPSVKFTGETHTELAINFGTYVPSDGETFTFITDATRQTSDPAYTNFFYVNNLLATPTTVVYTGGYAFKISYNGGSGGDIFLTIVPEPGSAVMLLGGIGLLGGIVRRRRSRNLPFGS